MQQLTGNLVLEIEMFLLTECIRIYTTQVALSLAHQVDAFPHDRMQYLQRSMHTTKAQFNTPA